MLQTTQNTVFLSFFLKWINQNTQLWINTFPDALKKAYGLLSSPHPQATNQFQQLVWPNTLQSNNSGTIYNWVEPERAPQ